MLAAPWPSRRACNCKLQALQSKIRALVKALVSWACRCMRDTLLGFLGACLRLGLPAGLPGGGVAEGGAAAPLGPLARLLAGPAATDSLMLMLDQDVVVQGGPDGQSGVRGLLVPEAGSLGMHVSAELEVALLESHARLLGSG